METNRTKELVYLLKFGGLWLNFSDHHYGLLITAFQIFRFVYLTVGWIFMVNIILIKGVKFLLTPSAVFVPLGFDVVVTSILFLFKIKDVERLILQCSENLSTYSEFWEQSLIHKDSKKVKYFADILRYGMIYFAIIYMLFPVIINIARVIMGNPERYITPVPFDAYLDETKERNFNFYIMASASYLWFVLGIPNTVAFQCTVFYIVSCATTEIDIVKHYIKSLYPEDDYCASILPDWNLCHIIKKHNQILRINKLQNESIALASLVQCRLIITLSLCFLMFLILLMYGHDDFLMILAAGFMFILLVLSAVLCSAGEYLEEKSDSLFYAVCDLPWYRQSVTSRKNYLFLVLQTSKTLLFHTAFTSSLNMRCCMQIINNSFSYLMIMKSFNQNEHIQHEL